MIKLSQAQIPGGGVSLAFDTDVFRSGSALLENGLMFPIEVEHESIRIQTPDGARLEPVVGADSVLVARINGVKERLTATNAFALATNRMHGFALLA